MEKDKSWRQVFVSTYKIYKWIRFLKPLIDAIYDFINFDNVIWSKGTKRRQKEKHV